MQMPCHARKALICMDVSTKRGGSPESAHDAFVLRTESPDESVKLQRSNGGQEGCAEMPKWAVPRGTCLRRDEIESRTGDFDSQRGESNSQGGEFNSHAPNIDMQDEMKNSRQCESNSHSGERDSPVVKFKPHHNRSNPQPASIEWRVPACYRSASAAAASPVKKDSLLRGTTR
jgi:hypothetical protein